MRVMAPEEETFWKMIDQTLKNPAKASQIQNKCNERFAKTRAVMWTDLTGFSRMSHEFGIYHFLRFIREMENTILPLLEKDRGRMLKMEGDSYLLIFPRVSQAVRAAIRVNRMLKKRNRDKSASETLEICIGIGYGSILLVGEHEAWGSELNFTSKLGEDVARSGEILLTEAAAAEARKSIRGIKLDERPGVEEAAIRIHYSVNY